ncbi:MAG: NADH-quinone oxidoreductase subunit M [Rickettsiales bacterium]|nr:NADH-quinone oxidoreductase subunit M [Rickettsiales bacterium]
MLDIAILPLLILIPLIGIVFVLLSVEDDGNSIQAKKSALWTSVINFLLSLYIPLNFDKDIPHFQFVNSVSWLNNDNLKFSLGIDGISFPFIMLSTLLIPLCILFLWHSKKVKIKSYLSAFLILESFLIGSFGALDLFSFYIFFESILIPMYLIIGIWGGDRRIYSAYKFFLYTLLGSVLMLVAIIFLYQEFGTTYIPTILDLSLPFYIQVWLWLAFFSSFAVKIPMWPFHTWLPDAHVEAPTEGSVILAGILLKLGGYGFIRFNLSMLPDASIFFTPFIFALSLVAIIYTSVIALVQKDMKKLIAYSSVAHMGFVTLGIFSSNMQGLHGAITQMISHGLISAALFFSIGSIYNIYKTKEINFFSGLGNIMPNLSVFFLIFSLSAIGFPGTSGFIGEFLTLLAVFSNNTFIAFFASTGIILAAAYMLLLYKNVFLGEMNKNVVINKNDIKYNEIFIYSILVILILIIGIKPNILLDYSTSSLERIMSLYPISIL